MDKTFITKLVADAVKYLGDKISTSKVEVDITSRAIEKLQDIDYRQINALIKEMKAIADGHARSNSDLIATLKAFEKATKDDSRVADILVTSRNVQKQMVTALERISNQLIEKEEPEDENENKDILLALANVEKAIRDTEAEEVELDLKPVVTELAALRKETATQATATVKALDAVVNALGQLPKKLEIPKEFKLDNEQLRSIRSSGGGAIAMPMDARTATDWQVNTVAITLADTEYEYTFPNNTISWTLKLRGTTGKLYYASSTGKLPVSGDNSAYVTVPANGTRSQDNVEYGGKKMYFESNLASQVVELDIFTM